MRESVALNRLRGISAAHAPSSRAMPCHYTYDQGFSEERARRAGIESLWDPGSQRLLVGQLGGQTGRRGARDRYRHPIRRAARRRHDRGPAASTPGPPGFDFFRLSFESLRDAVVNAGLLSREDADAAAARFAQDLRVQTPLMMAGIGRR
jgi:hypothetical protein